jgi:hypothetical protein
VAKNILTASRQLGELSLPEAGMPKLVSMNSVKKVQVSTFYDHGAPPFNRSIKYLSWRITPYAGCTHSSSNKSFDWTNNYCNSSSSIRTDNVVDSIHGVHCVTKGIGGVRGSSAETALEVLWVITVVNLYVLVARIARNILQLNPIWGVSATLIFRVVSVNMLAKEIFPL